MIMGNKTLFAAAIPEKNIQYENSANSTHHRRGGRDTCAWTVRRSVPFAIARSCWLADTGTVLQLPVGGAVYRHFRLKRGIELARAPVIG
eukprot:COSAG02_NODE_43993_length_370_cov_0.505535_1_plen_89_part_01